jgi:putative endonuclease
MARNHKRVGSDGEQAAVVFLETAGYRIVDMNVRPLGGRARGEIDLIAWEGESLVFVEVKTRRKAVGAQGSPSEAVHSRKRRQLLHLARAYIGHHELDDVPCRFDVLEVVEDAAGTVHFQLFAAAFDANDADVSLVIRGSTMLE